MGWGALALQSGSRRVGLVQGSLFVAYTADVLSVSLGDTECATVCH